LALSIFFLPLRRLSLSGPFALSLPFLSFLLFLPLLTMSDANAYAFPHQSQALFTPSLIQYRERLTVRGEVVEAARDIWKATHAKREKIY
jgi:hypothetical protein